MAEDLYFTEEEFKQLRKDILNVFESNGLTEKFAIQKSSYKWASQNNFRIRIEARADWRAFSRIGPMEKIQTMKNLFDTAVSFAENSSRDFTFIDVESKKSPFNYTFTFQPTVIRAKELLSGEKNGNK